MIDAIAGQGALIYPSVVRDSPGSMTCHVSTASPFFTLRQGQFVGALESLYQATSNQAYLTQAEAVANCVTAPGCGGDSSIASPPVLDSGGILTEPCTGSPYRCTVTGNPDYFQYKGVFMRNLYCLAQLTGSSAYGSFISTNAGAVYTQDQNPETTQPATQGLNQFGFTWDQWPAAGGSNNWATQGAALDALNADIGAGARTIISMC